MRYHHWYPAAILVAIIILIVYGVHHDISVKPTPNDRDRITGQIQQSAQHSKESGNPQDIGQSSATPQSQFVNSTPSGSAGQNQKADAADKSTDWWMAIFNGILAIVAVVQARLLYITFKANRINARATVRSARAAERAAVAAKSSAEALPALERAYVFIEIDPRSASGLESIVGNIILNDEMNRGARIAEPVIRFQFVNHGKTPAIIRAISANFCYLSDLPPAVRYVDEPLDQEIVIASGAVYPPPYDNDDHGRIGQIQRDMGVPRFVFFQKNTTIETPLAVDDARSIRAGRSFLWFYGHVAYLDVFGRPHETCFCWRYTGQDACFRRYDRPSEHLNCRT